MYNNEVKVTEWKFNPVGDITVKNEDVALAIMEEFYNDLRVYIPGTYFKVPANSNSVFIEDDEPDNIGTGIWIGWFISYIGFIFQFILIH